MDNAEGGLFGRVRGNAEWEGIKWLWAVGRSAVITAIYGVFQRARHIQVDWIGLGILFALCLVAGFMLIRFRERKPKGAKGDQPAPSIAVDKLFSPLQLDTFQLAKDLQEFVDSMGPPAQGNPELNDGSNAGFVKFVRDDVHRGSAWRNKFNAEYVAKFSQRVKYLRNEVAKCNVVPWPVIPDDEHAIYPNNVIALPPIIARSGMELQYPRPKDQVIPSLFSPLQIEAFQLTKDMRDFLKELGPRPLVPVDAYKNSSDSVFEHIKAQYALDHKWSEKLTNGYGGRFADRVKAMKYKFGELGLRDEILDTASVYQAESVASVASAITNLATQIEEL